MGSHTCQCHCQSHHASPLCHSKVCLHREYGTIDDVDIDLHVNISFLDVSPWGSSAVGRVGTRTWGVPKIPLPGWRSRGRAKVCLSLGRRRWQQRGRCCGRSPSSSACASPSPSTSMAPVSGDRRDVMPLSPWDRWDVVSLCLQDRQDVVSLCPQDRHSGASTARLLLSLQNRPSRFSSRPTRRALGWVCS